MASNPKSPGPTRTDIEANLFPASHGAIKTWESFPWHRDRSGNPTAHRRWSSQALAIDVFGTVSQLDSRDSIVHAWMKSFGLDSEGDWRLCLEWKVPKSVLGEPRSTQLDAYARDGKNVVLFECKFTETGGGSCSQTRPIRNGPMKGKPQCDGSYAQQPNPLNGINSSCALSGKNIRYWDWIPKVTGYSSSEIHRPCPFAGDSFQWMRNVVAAAALGDLEKRRPVFVVVHADAPGSDDFPVAKKIRSAKWRDFTKRVAAGPVYLRVTSYGDLLQVAHQAASRNDAKLMDELGRWVWEKECDAAARLRERKHRRHGSDSV